MLKSIGGHLRSHGGLVGTEQCKRSFFLNPRACSSGCNRMPKGGIWLGLKSKDFSSLQLKTELYAGLQVDVENFKQYCIESFWRCMYSRGTRLYSKNMKILETQALQTI